MTPSSPRPSPPGHAFDGTAVGPALEPVLALLPSGDARVMIAGAGPGAWVRALLAAGRRVVALDASRPALAALVGEAGPDAPLEPIHGDPRDLAPTPGLAAVLVPPPLLPALGTGEERRASLAAFAEELADPSARAPRRVIVVLADPPDAADLAGSGPDGTETTAERDAHGRLLVRHRHPDGTRTGLLLADLDREAIEADLRASGFAIETVDRTAGGWVVTAVPAGDRAPGPATG